MTESRLPLPSYVQRTRAEPPVVDHTGGGLYPDVDPATGDEAPIEGFDEAREGAASDDGNPRLKPTVDSTPKHGMSWRDGLDTLDRLLDDCAQDGQDHLHFVRVGAVRDVVSAVRRYEDDTDESIRSALWEDAVTSGETWAMGDDDA